MVDIQKTNEIKQSLSEKDIYIHFLIDLAFDIHRLVRNGNIDFSMLISPSASSDWENLTRMLPYLPKQLVIIHLDQLLDGFMDLNWPGSPILYGYLSQMEIEPLKASFDRVIRKAIDLNDTDWLYFLLVFMEDDRVNLQNHFIDEIERCRSYLIEQGVDID